MMAGGAAETSKEFVSASASVKIEVLYSCALSLSLATSRFRQQLCSGEGPEDHGHVDHSSTPTSFPDKPIFQLGLL